MSVIAIIPARMGSARMPRKNLCEIEPGLTLVQQAIDCARFSGIVDQVIVSSDEPIQCVGADVVIQPPEVSGPDDDITDAVAHTAQRVLGGSSANNLIVTLQPAVIARSPLIVRRLVEAVSGFRHMGAQPSGGLTMASTHRWIWRRDGHRAWNDWHGQAYPRSNNSAPRLVEINAVQVATYGYVTARQRWGVPLAILTLPPWAAALDIDTPEDLEQARDLWPWAKSRLETCEGQITIVDQVMRCDP